MDGLDFGFIILCPDRNPGALKNTCGSVRHHSYDRDAIAVVGNDANKEDIATMKEICPTYKGKDTITSLVNKGFYHLKHEWGFIVFAGSRVQPLFERRLKPFANEYSDILFPVVEKRCDFVSGSFNGVLINKKFFKEVGKFPETTMIKEGVNDFEMAKLFWAVDAVAKGAKFKGIVGLRVI